MPLEWSFRQLRDSGAEERAVKNRQRASWEKIKADAARRVAKKEEA